MSLITTHYDEVGQIINTHGLNGEVKVAVSTDFPAQRFVRGHFLYYQQHDHYHQLTLARVRPQQQFMLLTFAEMTTLDQVLPLKNQKLYVHRDDQKPLGQDEYYYHDIVGLQVIDRSRQQAIGTVSEILSTGANDVWVVKRAGQKDLLLPFLKSVVRQIDLDQKKVFVDVPLGLDD